MEEQAKIKSTETVFAICDATGAVPYRPRVGVSQVAARVENGVTYPAESDFVEFDSRGLCIIQKGDKRHDARVAAIIAKAKRDENLAGKAKIIGPFDCTEDALREQQVQRPKSSDERASIEKSRADKLDEENANLRKRIAELSKSEIKNTGENKKP